MELTPLGNLLYALSPANNFLGRPRWKAIEKSMEESGFIYKCYEEDSIMYRYEDINIRIYFNKNVYFIWRSNEEYLWSKAYKCRNIKKVGELVKRLLFENEYKGCKGRYEYIQKQRRGEIPMPPTHPNIITTD